MTIFNKMVTYMKPGQVNVISSSCMGFQKWALRPLGVHKDKMGGGVRGLTHQVKFKVTILNVWIFIFYFKILCG